LYEPSFVAYANCGPTIASSISGSVIANGNINPGEAKTDAIGQYSITLNDQPGYYTIIADHPG
jgi:hypothetical protein